MSLSESQFLELVHRMERFAEAAPRAYRRRVLALAGIGYLYMLVLVVGLATLGAVAVVMLHAVAALLIKVLIVLGVLLAVVLRSLWVRMERPRGEQVSRGEAPQLFALLERLCASLRAPPVHHVIVMPQLNAAVTQVPRLGIFGWHRNYLLLGLPLLKCLTVEQLAAVLGHELGHLAGGHARVGNWIYRLRLTWQCLDKGLAARGGWGAKAIQAFLHWYIPYFNACSFPLARRNEFEADASSVRLTSAQAAAQALTSVSVIDHYLDWRYWPAIGARSRDCERPAFAPFTALDATALQQLDSGTARGWLALALAQASTYADTHPSLKARLDAIGMQPELALPVPGADTTADSLLGERGVRLAALFDERWREHVAPTWQKQFAQAQQARVRLRELREQAQREALEPKAGFELAALEERLGDDAGASLARWRELHAREPQSGPVRFALARQLLLQGDAEGVPLMERTVAEEPQATLGGCSLLRDYWWRRGEQERGMQWHTRAADHEQVLRTAKAERQPIRRADTFLEHGLDAETYRALALSLQQIRGLDGAYLVRKRVTILPEQPCYVLAYSITGTADATAVREELGTRVTYPGETLLMHLQVPGNAPFAAEFRKVPNAKIL
jgi:Zn-dependent protease with chaperone function